MALISTLRGGPLISEKSYDIDNTRAANLIEWFIYNWAGNPPDGLTQQQINQWKLEQAHNKLIDYFKSEVERNRRIMRQPEIEAIYENISNEVTLSNE